MTPLLNTMAYFQHYKHYNGSYCVSLNILLRLCLTCVSRFQMTKALKALWCWCSVFQVIQHERRQKSDRVQLKNGILIMFSHTTECWIEFVLIAPRGAKPCGR